MNTKPEYEKLFLNTCPIRIRKMTNHISQNRTHWHEEIEVLYFTKGNVTTSCNLTEYHVNNGDIVFINGKELHTGVVSGTESEYFCCHFDTFFFSNFIGGEYVTFQNIIRDSDCTHLLDRIIESYSRTGYENEISVKCLCYRFFEIIIRKYVKNVFSEAEYRKQFKKLDKFNSIIEYINEHYDDDLSVKALAKHFYMSESYFLHFFKNKSGKSVIQYINEVKIHHAKSFLEKEDMSVGEIACTIGFNDISYFSRKFKAITGLTPTEYKKRL